MSLAAISFPATSFASTTRPHARTFEAEPLRPDTLSVNLERMGVVLALSAAPASTRGLTVERAPGDIIRINVAPDGFASCAALFSGGIPTGPATQALRDPVVERLSQALGEVEDAEGAGGLYADAMRLALVTRILSLRSEPAAERTPEVPAAPRRPRLKSGLPKWRLKRALAYIDDHLGEAVTLAGMAEAAGLSRMHFAAQFRVATGVRPHEFLLRRRIERAQSIMRETREPLIQVALAVGFQTQAHFTTVFRRIVGDTPYQWRCAARVPA